MKARAAVLTLTPAEAAALEAEREARRAAALVALFVGVPAALAAGATIVLVAVTSLVLLAPVVAVVLSVLAWRFGRPVEATGTPPARSTSGA